MIYCDKGVITAGRLPVFMETGNRLSIAGFVTDLEILNTRTDRRSQLTPQAAEAGCYKKAFYGLAAAMKNSQ